MNSTGAGGRGRPAQRHRRLLREPVALAQVAGRAGGDDVLPHRVAAAAARDDVVECQPAAARAAVDAAPLVAGEQRASRDLPLRRARHPHVGDEPDHVRPREGVRRGAERQLVLLEHLRLPLEHEHVRAPHRAHVQRLVARIQDEDLAQSAGKRSHA